MKNVRPKKVTKPKKATVFEVTSSGSEVINIRALTTEELYQAAIKVFGKVYRAEGSTLSEAITKLKPDGLARGLSVLTVTKGETRQEKILPRVATSRLFSPSPMIREAALKMTIQRFTV